MSQTPEQKQAWEALRFARGQCSCGRPTSRFKRCLWCRIRANARKQAERTQGRTQEAAA